jgi:predicted lipoprotein with Yx(FWY)xxD motif
MRTKTALIIAVTLAVVGLASVAAAAPSATDAADARATLTVRSSDYGRILFDGRGQALYAFTADSRNRSNCSGSCATAWPPYIVSGMLRAGNGVDGSLLRTIRRADGRRQVTYNGWPLYYYVGDNGPGVVRCQNVREFGGLWLVVRPGGSLVR